MERGALGGLQATGPVVAGPFPAEGRTARLLALASCVALFQELVLIRWMGTQVRVLAYFPNLILIGSFLGLGLGCIRAERRSRLDLWPALLVGLALLTGGLGRIIFTQNDPSEHLWLLYYDLPQKSLVVKNTWSPILVCFVLAATSFVPLGQYVAQRLRDFQEAGRPLSGYLWDIGGALAGVACFAAVSWTGWPPAAWFALIISAGVFLHDGRRARLRHAALGALAIAAVALCERAGTYSPYYALAVDPSPLTSSFGVLANGSLHQLAFPVRRRSLPGTDLQRRARDGYHLPYRLLARPPRRALVLGAGTGNDVAVLLDEGAGRVDAVEIDPGILALGRKHPDLPYSSDRVRVFNTDARAFLNGTQESYDLIVFGTLDSMTRLSAMSNVRLDNFVYTEEALRAAKSRLTPDGGVVLYFMVPEAFIADRLEGLLFKVFGQLPLVHAEHHGLFNRIYLAGPAFAARGGPGRAKASEHYGADRLSALRLPTDDWPFLYLRKAAVSPFYLCLLTALAGIALSGVWACTDRPRQALKEAGALDAVMFLFGLGFLLLETRAVTALSLLWGATWITSAAVFAAILLMVFLSTLVSVRRAVPWAVSALALTAALAASAVIPVGQCARDSLALKTLASVGVAGVPVFFAGLAFAWFFGRHPSSPRAFAWNLMGAVTGGFMESLSMSLGLRALAGVAFAAYLAAFLIFARWESREAAPRSPPVSP